MKKVALFFSFILFAVNTSANDKCFIFKENNKILKEEGDCKSRYSPASTFKIALSLMGFDAGVLEDDTHPKWPFKEGYDYYINVCKGPHDPRTRMRDSCVWYSQVLTPKLGM